MRHPKQFLKRIIQKTLEKLVKIKLGRTKPTIVGVTGTIGKTSVKEAVFEVMRVKWRVYRNPKSLNTEIGLLLAVLEQPSGFSSPFKWTFILVMAFFNAFFSRKYDFLILEYGADKPDDIKHLASLVKPHIAIITNITRVHQAEGQFKNIEEVFDEKKKIVECLGKMDIAILNHKNDYLKTLEGNVQARIFWFNGKDISASDLKTTETGFSAKITTPYQSVDAEFCILGTHHINVILPALVCGMVNGITLEEGISALQNFRLLPGRMSLIEGKNGSTLLDSTYNASPEAVREALRLLHEYPGKRKIAVLGNMNELGPYADEAHKNIGRQIKPWLDLLITVGENAKKIANCALKNGFPESRIKTLKTAREAAEFLTPTLKEKDVILLKGSQNKVRLERAVKLLMADPKKAKHLLCRQEKEWEPTNYE